MIVQNVSEDGATTDLTFTVPASDYERARDTITAAKGHDRLYQARQRHRCGQGLGDRHRHAQPCRRRRQGLQALAARNINIRAITTSEIKFSVLIDAAYTELAVRTLHTLYGLDQA
jgi:aspartate kinase